MRPRIANAVDKLCGKSDVYLASTFSSINNSTFRESSFLLSFSLSPPPPCLSSSSSIIPAAQWMNRADSRERFFAYQTGVHYSRVCETRPGFTILIRPVLGFMHVRSIDGSIDRIGKCDRDRCFSRNDHIPARVHSIIALVYFFFIFHTSLLLPSFSSLESE